MQWRTTPKLNTIRMIVTGLERVENVLGLGHRVLSIAHFSHQILLALLCVLQGQSSRQNLGPGVV